MRQNEWPSSPVPTQHQSYLHSIGLDNELNSLGNTLSPEMVRGTAAFFADRMTTSEKDRSFIERDEPYGQDPKQKVDFFRSPVSTEVQGAILFVHGGGFIAGNKQLPDTPFYDNVGHWSADAGYLGATMTYRLAPDAVWPSGSIDISNCIALVGKRLRSLGCDPRRIVLLGQSAGAAHVASYIADGSNKAVEHISGAAMLSGIFQPSLLPETPLRTAYYGSDIKRYPIQATIDGMIGSGVPCLFTVATLDPPPFQEQANALVRRWYEAAKYEPDFHLLSGHNHVSPAMSLGLKDNPLSSLLLNFAKQSIEHF